MAENNKNSVAGSQSKINPGIISQMQNYARIREQLPKQAVMASNTKYIESIPKSPESNANLKRAYEIGTKITKTLYDNSAMISLGVYTHEMMVKKYSGFKDKLTRLEELAKKSGNPKLGERAVRILNKFPKLGKAELEVEIAKIGEATKNIGNPGLTNQFGNVVKESKKLTPFMPKTMVVASKIGKIPLINKVLAAFDVFTLVKPFYKLLSKSKEKPTFGEWVDSGISALSLTGTVLGVIGSIASIAGATALAASLAPVIATIGTVALVAGLAKFGYDKLLSDEALKAAPKNKKMQAKPVIPIDPFEMSKVLKYNVIPKDARVVPRNARGTSYFPGGLSLIGEEGPELVNLPRGSQVFSNSRTQSLLKGMGSGSTGISVNYSPQITIQGNADAHVMKTASDNSYADFERKFNALMDRRRRLSFAGG